MNRDEILSIPTGREMDVKIAENIFKLKTYQSFGGEFMVKSETVKRLDVKHYSTNISAAWEVIEWMREHTTEKYTAPSLFSVPAGWSMVLYEKNDNHAPAWLDAFAETAPLAICRAALIAVLCSD